MQVDASVTDSHGNPVPDLQASDFRILLDGKPQAVQYCNFVRDAADARPAPVSTPVDPLTAPSGHPAMPSRPIEHAAVRRSIVLFIGDLLTSSESIPAIRAGLKKFVLEQVRPGDLVAIVRSSAGFGALQDFTTDKGMLLAAIDQVRFTSNAVGSAMASAYEPLGLPSLDGLGMKDMVQLEKIDATERVTLETTATLLRIVRRMAGLPGRKSVVLISDGLRLASPDELNPFTQEKDTGTGAFLSPIYTSMRRVVDESLRAGVVVYAIDTRGLSSLNAQASDRLKNDNPAQGLDVRAATQSRRDEYSDNQWGGMFLSGATGGFMITEANRIEAGLERVMADQRGYYLLGFHPPTDAMSPDIVGTPDFHRLKVEVLRPGLTVRSHSGFFGIGDEFQSAMATPAAKMSTAFGSPFPPSEIRLDAEAAYLVGKKDYLIRTAVYIDGKDVAFTGPANHRTGTLRLVVRAFNANGEAAEGGIDETRRIDVDEDGYRRAREFGLIFATTFTVAKPGPYAVRVVCLDDATGKIGAGEELVAIPAAKSDGPRLSGMVFAHDLGTDDHVVPAERPNVYSAGQTVRFRFQFEGRAATPFTLRTRLFRDGVEVWQSESAALVVDAAKFAGGSLVVPTGLGAGTYAMRVDVEDPAGTPLAWQWAKLRIR